jgi:hypothetical protein
MKDFGFKEIVEFKVVCSLVVLPICFSTLCNLVVYALKEQKVFFYLRLIFAMGVMIAIWTMELSYCIHQIPKYYYNLFGGFSKIFMINLVSNLQSFKVLPTLLYTWQYYDVTSLFIYKKRIACTYWLRYVAICLICVCLIASSITYDIL